MEESQTIQSLEQALSVINLDNMDVNSEVQLAAELGKILLERNTALEEMHERNRRLIAEQQAEIDKLLHQSIKLQETNSSCMKVSEQLEHNIFELERSNRELKKQQSADQDILRELNEKKEFLQQRCDVLQESQEFIEEKLQKVQIKIEEHDKEIQLSNESKLDLAMFEEPTQLLNKTTDEIIDQIGYLSTNLSDCRCEVATYYERIERMENQIAMLLQKNIELEDVISSGKRKSDTATSDYGSGNFKNSTSLLEEIEAANNYNSLESFDNGCYITSTPPKEIGEEIKITSSSVHVENESVQDPTTKKTVKKIKKEFTKNLNKEFKPANPAESTEQQVRINVSIEIEPPFCQTLKKGNSPNGEHTCRHGSLRNLARKLLIASNKIVMNGIIKLLKSLIKHPQNYLATLLLWSNRNYIQDKIIIV